MVRNLEIFATEDLCSDYCRNTIVNLLKNKPNALICLAAGHTSLPLFKKLIESEADENIDFSKVKFVGLDEWEGLSGDDDGSCENFLRRNLFDHINLKEENIRLFNGKAADLKKECKQVETFIENNGGIDYMLLGVGMNGHLGLNEPGTDESSTTAIVKLDNVTLKVADKYFNEKPDLKGGVTLGIKSIVDTKKVDVLITGEKKKNIVKDIYYTEKTKEIPATLLKNYEHVTYVLDNAAAGLI